MSYNYSAQARATFAVDRRALSVFFDAPIIGFDASPQIPGVLLGDVEERLKTPRDEYEEKIAKKAAAVSTCTSIPKQIVSHT